MDRFAFQIAAQFVGQFTMRRISCSAAVVGAITRGIERLASYARKPTTLHSHSHEAG